MQKAFGMPTRIAGMNAVKLIGPLISISEPVIRLLVLRRILEYGRTKLILRHARNVAHGKDNLDWSQHLIYI